MTTPTGQLTIDDAITAGIQAKRRGMAKAQRGVDPEWEQAAYASAYALADTGRPFTSNDVIDYITENYPRAQTHQLRAMGPVMSRLASEKVIRPTGDWGVSTRPGNHRLPKRIWIGVKP